MPSQSEIYGREEKSAARDCASPGRVIRVGAFLPSTTAGCIDRYASDGLINSDSILVCFEDNSQGNFAGMKRAVGRILTKHKIKPTVIFREGRIESDIMDCAEEHDLEFDYVFLDYCGYAQDTILQDISTWEDWAFSDDCVISATFRSGGQGQGCLDYLLSAASKASAYRARFVNYAGDSDKCKEFSLCQQVGLCHALPFMTTVRNALNYRHMLVMRVMREKHGKPNLHGMSELLNRRIMTVGDAISSWSDHFEFDLSVGERARIARLVNAGETVCLDRIDFTSGQRASLTRAINLLQV